jgi:hypothetical protein
MVCVPFTYREVQLGGSVRDSPSSGSSGSRMSVGDHAIPAMIAGRNSSGFSSRRSAITLTKPWLNAYSAHIMSSGLAFNSSLNPLVLIKQVEVAEPRWFVLEDELSRPTVRSAGPLGRCEAVYVCPVPGDEDEPVQISSNQASLVLRPDRLLRNPRQTYDRGLRRVEQGNVPLLRSCPARHRAQSCCRQGRPARTPKMEKRGSACPLLGLAALAVARNTREMGLGQ